MPELLGHRLRQTWKQFVAVFVIEPQTASSIPVVVESVRAGREPHLLHLRLARKDKLRAAPEFDRHDAVGGGVVHFVGVEVLEPFRDIGESGVGEFAKFVVVHVGIVSKRRHDAAIQIDASALTLPTTKMSSDDLSRFAAGDKSPSAGEVIQDPGFFASLKNDTKKVLTGTKSRI